jgi:hypothetical protein
VLTGGVIYNRLIVREGQVSFLKFSDVFTNCM